MKCHVGIDLGSTTTKAVVLDCEQRVLGRGITNSRSNYDVACAIARAEAFANVRLTLCARSLADFNLSEAERVSFLAHLEQSYKLSQHRARLDTLGAQLAEEAPSVEKLFVGSELSGAVREIMDLFMKSAESLFAPGAPKRSDFFRDTATSQYHQFAQRIASPPRRSFEALMAVFDKSILKVENNEYEVPFDRGAGPAIDRALATSGIAAHRESPRLRETLAGLFTLTIDAVASVGTGYGRARLPFPKEQIRSEILCHGLGAHQLFPATATVLDIGGQDTKAIQVDDRGIVTSFQMNDRCAAGCGRYLGYIADEMNLGLHELSPIAEQAKRPVKISSTCTVFAGAEIRDRLTLGQKREDVLAGLHRAVILRALSLLARSGGVKNEFTFTGGVAKNATAVRILKDLIVKNYGNITMNVSADSIYTGALGAALFAARSAPKLEKAAV
ncbi:MAG: benzoyl-CoA reductase subunit A [Planctomycetes bacterium]|nr:benzoyl-CoA reductase subunit A [Planctomycetota bacterium]